MLIEHFSVRLQAYLWFFLKVKAGEPSALAVLSGTQHLHPVSDFVASSCD